MFGIVFAGVSNALRLVTGEGMDCFGTVNPASGRFSTSSPSSLFKVSVANSHSIISFALALVFASHIPVIGLISSFLWKARTAARVKDRKLPVIGPR